MRSALAAITRNNNPQSVTSHALTCAAALLLIATGAVVMAAWHSHSEWLWANFPGLRMKYNSSLTFIASGVGLLAALYDKKQLTMAVGTIVLTIGAAVCIQSLVDGNFGFDQFLMKDYLWPNAVYPGRMAFRGGFVFICCGLVLLLRTGGGRQKLSYVVAQELLTFAVLVVAVRAIVGNLDNPGIVYGLRGPSTVSTAGVVALAALGLGLVALIWPHRSPRIARVPLWIPALLCFLVLLLDLSTPRGFAGAIAYIPIIFCSLWFTQSYMAFVFAAIATALAVFGHFDKASGDIVPWLAVASRAMSVGALWFVAILVFLNRRSDGAFKQSRSRLQAVVDHALDGLIAINEQGIVEHFNPACERIFGYRSDEVVGHNIKMLMPEPYHGEHDGYLTRYLKTGEAHIIGTSGREVTARRKDGSEFPMDLSISTFHLEDGRHFSGIVRDITERKKIERQIIEEATRTQAVMNTVLDGVITIDERGFVQTFNPSAVRIFGYQPEEVVGHNIKMLMPEPYHGEHDGYLKSYTTTGRAKLIGIGREVSGKRKGGSVFPMELGVNEIRVENARMFVGTVRDISERKHAEEVKWQLAAVVESSVDAIITKTPDGVIVSWNAAAERIFGYRSEEVVGRHIDFFAPDERQAEEAHIISEVESGRRVEHLETVRLAKDGRSVDISMTVSPIRDSEGRLIGATRIARDISERKHAEEVKWQLAAVVSSSVDAIITEAPDGVIVSWNAAAERLFGYRSEEVIGRHIDFLVPRERQAEEARIVSEVNSGKRIEHFETVRLAKDGRNIDISLTVSPIRDSEGRLIGATRIARDISERKATELTLQRYNNDLERSNQELDDFAYIASHDLKEPLRGLFNHAQFLMEDYGDKLNKDGMRRLARLGQLCQRMEQLINDLMYYSRLGRAELAIKNTDVNAVIADIQKTMDVFIDERHAQIVVPHSLPTAFCDPVRTTEVFRNLIANAVKYCGNDSPLVEIGFIDALDTASGVERDVFYVKDNGIGIEPEFHQEIFRIFRRLQAPAGAKEAGTGVGLAFVKKIVERQGGRIWLESEAGKGATFYFTLSSHSDPAMAA
jgi:PAS domain S-box-containing protein